MRSRSRVGSLIAARAWQQAAGTLKWRAFRLEGRARVSRAPTTAKQTADPSHSSRQILSRGRERVSLEDRDKRVTNSRASYLDQDGFFGHSYVAIFVVLCAGVAE